jgi:hypothetical protein
MPVPHYTTLSANGLLTIKEDKMKTNHVFKWGADTYIMSANWANASEKIIVNGRQIYGCVAEFKHNPKNAARHILNLCCEFDGLHPDDDDTKAMIEKALTNMK